MIGNFLVYGVPAKIYSNKIFSGTGSVSLPLVLYYLSAAFYHGAASDSDGYLGLARAGNIFLSGF